MAVCSKSLLVNKNVSRYSYHCQSEECEAAIIIRMAKEGLADLANSCVACEGEGGVPPGEP